MGGWALGMRGMMVTVEGEDYMTFAEATGLKNRTLFFTYALRNALLPQTTALGLSLSQILSGALLVEVIFSYPGIGTVLFHAIRGSDYYLIQGIVFILIVSIGLALGLRYVILFFFGARTESYAQYAVQDASTRISVWEVSLLPRSLTIMLLALLVIVAVAMFLLRARFGKAIRAVSDNPDLAASSGIDADRVILIVWMLGGALAGLGGIFYGLEFGVKWDMGFTLLLLMFAAITLGGLGNPFGALLGSLVIGVFVELWTWVVPNANDLKTVGALVALIAVLLVRPQGLLGSKERIG